MKTPVLAAAVVLVGAMAGCGSDDSKPQLKVSAAASLKQALTEYGAQFDQAEVRNSFAGSDELAAQIEQGARPDVFAAANTSLPDQLFEQGLVEKPQVFATNELVIAVPADGSDIDSIDDLGDDGVTIASGDEDVAVGAYTRKVLAGLPADESQSIEQNIRSNEPDVAGVTAKVTSGAVDAGFIYATDVEAAKGDLRAVQIPEELKPLVEYGVAVVTAGGNPDLAREYVDGLMHGIGREDLAEAGFAPPPPN